MAPRKSGESSRSTVPKTNKGNRVKKPKTRNQSSNQGPTSVSKRAKKSKNRASDAGGENATKRTRKRPSLREVEDLEESIVDDRPEPPTSREFSYLKPTTKKISQDVISTEWNKLPDPAQKRIVEIMRAAKREVVNQSQNAKRAMEAEEVVEHLISRMSSRLGRLPMPPSSKEGSFNLEKLLEKKRNLDLQSTATLNSIKIIKAEIEREQDQLDAERERLEKLETDGESEERMWNEQTKNLGLSLPLESSNDNDDDPDQIGLMEDSDSIFDEDDPDLAPVLSELMNHLRSIRANTQQFEGVATALTTSSMAVNAMLTG
ncbi:hypothetical protein BT63DRAFT_441857 [Microthyrium microscopicum]|uniref:CENP-Q, a CENPA-CAD centromere complex subunit n=1 Tax=Microthyrium microscopicum TaxID=703497 RepID=A0A6A6U4H4_9PEZI|nr:hypothetical protein BT63DRAFT_441857 [Microthyrium microscopicum]